MKKIILVLIITALSLLVSTAVVTAHDEGRRGFSGVYRATIYCISPSLTQSHIYDISISLSYDT